MINIPGMLMVGASCKADGKTTFTCSLIEKRWIVSKPAIQ